MEAKKVEEAKKAAARIAEAQKNIDRGVRRAEAKIAARRWDKFHGMA